MWKGYMPFINTIPFSIYKRLEHPWVLVSEGESSNQSHGVTKGRLYFTPAYD